MRRDGGPPWRFSIEVHLDVEAIWPDGDAPTDPTVHDVARIVQQCGGSRVIRDWDLDIGGPLIDGMPWRYWLREGGDDG